MASSSSPPVLRLTISTGSIGLAIICTRNCVIALDANTGKKLWHFQATRHDLWDSDFSAPPILLTVNRNGRRVDAVAATNKFGFIYIFDRVTGESAVSDDGDEGADRARSPGEITSPTQPIPTLPAPLAKLTMTRDEVTNRTPEMRALGAEGVRHVPRHQPTLHTVEHRQTNDGGARLEGRRRVGWLSADPEKGIIYANVNNVMSLGSLTARGNAPPGAAAAAAAKPAAPANPGAAAAGKPYVFTGYRYFVDPEGYQANAYPWGTLNAIDMNTGKYLWTVPFGEHTELAEKGLTNTGAGSHGGTVLTATGVLFTGGSEYDLKFRAYDSATGKVLWTGLLPGPGVATPATYAVNGKQYVVIAVSPTRGGGGVRPLPPRTAGIKSAPTWCSRFPKEIAVMKSLGTSALVLIAGIAFGFADMTDTADRSNGSREHGEGGSSVTGARCRARARREDRKSGQGLRLHRRSDVAPGRAVVQRSPGQQDVQPVGGRQAAGDARQGGRSRQLPGRGQWRLERHGHRSRRHRVDDAARSAADRPARRQAGGDAVPDGIRRQTVQQPKRSRLLAGWRAVFHRSAVRLVQSGHAQRGSG